MFYLFLNELIYTKLKPVIFIYSLLVLFLFFKAFSQHTFSKSILIILASLLTWSLTEYLIHRFIFHLNFDNDRFKQFKYFIHGYHHQYPTDPARLLLPLIITLPLTICIYLIIQLINPYYINPILSGFLLGYLIYDISHYSIHRLKPRSRLGKFRKSYHFHHHFKDYHCRFGVSTPLWDYVLNTK